MRKTCEVGDECLGLDFEKSASSGGLQTHSNSGHKITSAEGYSSESCSGNLVFTLSSAGPKTSSRAHIGNLIVKRPLAAVALLPQPLVLFSAGAFAGALGDAH